MNLTAIRKSVDKVKQERALVLRQIKDETAQLEHYKQVYSNAEEGQQLLQTAAQAVQQQAHKKIAAVVTRCLETVFDEPYEFKIHFERKRGRTEARLVFERDGYEIDPITASGGGVIDVAAFALRLACLILNKPRLRKVMLLDEPFKFVSAEYIHNVRHLLEGLSKDFKVQFIIVTHIEGLKTGKIIRIGKTKPMAHGPEVYVVTKRYVERKHKNNE